MSANRQPALFIGHGSPLGALEDSPWSRTLRALGARLGTPECIAVVSAHWLTHGTCVTGDARPRTIHDFHGFPAALHALEYPAPGSPSLAWTLAESLSEKSRAPVKVSSDWGLDHGAWSVLVHLFPEARVPTLQISLDRGLAFEEHIALASALEPWRDKGVLIVCTGNITHNLGELDADPEAPARPWAIAFDAEVKKALLAREAAASQLARMPEVDHSLWKRAHPTAEHFLPLLYALGASRAEDTMTFPYEGLQHGTLSMRCVKWE